VNRLDELTFCAGPWHGSRTAGHDGMSPIDSLVARVRGEYGEMPGLRLTVSQASRLWHVDPVTCETLLEHLVREGFLYKTDAGAYMAHPPTRN
jgi:hypothetical protein